MPQKINQINKVMANKENYPKIALGTWSWGTGAAGGDQVFGNNLSAKDLKPVFDTAMKNGLNLWDTATVYGMGSSESILASFVKQCPREQVAISTKFTPQIAPDSPGAVEEMLDASLKRFETDYVDIYWIHNPADVERWTPGLIPLLKKGKVKRVGVSNHNLAELKRAEEILSAEGFHISAVQNHYSLIYRSSEDAGIIDYCNRYGMTFFAYMVLEQDALSGKYDAQHLMPQNTSRGETYNSQLPRIEKLLSVLRETALRHEASVSQVAIAWAIAKHTLPIIGVTKMHHVEDAVKAAKLNLAEDELSLLDSTSREMDVNTKGSWEHSMC